MAGTPFFIMGFFKNYMLELMCACSPDNAFGQDAIEWAVLFQEVKLSGSYNIQTDIEIIMNNYDSIVEKYHAAQAKEAA